MPTPAASADRNLLFGVLALQMDFVTRDALVAAMNAWAVEKGTPLGDILVRQGALRPELRALLDPLVAKHLEMHGGDPQRSLAAVSSISPSARAALAGVADRDVQASLLRLPGEKPAPAGPADPLATRAVSVLSKEATGLRYQVLRPHAKGGLGEVFVARDAETNREVALKEIQSHAAADPEARSRFLFEAEVTAGLEHPGVVPVYGLGAYPDGRPFYAMRFIRGDSLAQAIARFHSEQGKTLSDSERNLAFRDLLGRFVDVCETLAYAHARGVLHRDLKPGNVMLGRHGETLVVDWGLAKVTGRPDTHAGNGASAAPTPATPTAADEPALVPGSGSAPTQAGRLLGTPGYMSPEQAEGRLDRLGPASDVYGLGATLYHLLTGKPPVEGGDLGEVLRKVRTGEIPPPREANPEVPKPLDAICRKATALRPEDRYATAADLAADVEKFLADEAVSALADSPLDRAGRWARRNRSAVRTGVVAALIFFTAVFAAERWYANEQAERAAEQAAPDVE
ncbi:MAG TPA: serine/threonine-protein kinase, partial [Planctomycetaceae bacterium]